MIFNLHKKTKYSVIKRSKDIIGFVYIWRDKKHKRYYIGSHWGTINDGYICSSRWMKAAFKRRPQDFKRRVISSIITSKKDLLEEEYRYLLTIKPEELGKKYYNLKNTKDNHWSADPEKRLEVTKKLQGRIHSPETRLKMSNSAKGKQNCLGRKASNESKLKMSKSHLGQISWNKGLKMSEESKLKMSKAKLGKSPWNKGKTGVQIASSEERLNMSIAQQKRRVK